ncbi:LPP20 lipoprotein [Marinomonas alcarazii]|uniref:LPP20 lipoprotein n=1 Tax=Marinomonas alcarazii TaxID=491949 RepID=A0A318UTX5_9GAMM|nr:LPP20 family lipoprotein [Marinomonas alcarazii]PYF79966.1 LPP20 lipoprotein [Marinomonas alcarazii]
MKLSALPTPYNWIMVTGLLLSLTGCAGLMTSSEQASETIPDWVLSPPRDNNHLYGVGSAPRIENIALAFTQAEQNGNAQIAQQLRTQVSQINTQDTQVRSGQGGEQVSKTQTAYTQVTTSPIELEQTKNEKRFAGENYVYAMQSIDRRRIVAKLKVAINDTDATIRKEAALLSTADDQYPAPQDWQTYMQLIPYFAQRKSYVDELTLYSVERTSAGKADADIQAIEKRLNLALSHYGFDVSSTKQADQLASALSHFGLTPKSGSLFKLNSKTIQHTEEQDGRFYAFEDGTLELIDPSGSRLASWTVSARGIAKNLGKAQEQASYNWSKQAIEAMFTWLTRLD